jgi:mannose-1-phosphate guanylyltransferase/mannose-6-phosphate isomerase
VGGQTLFQKTVQRMKGLEGAAAPMVVTGLPHLALARRQLKEIGSDGFIVAEPEARDSAAAMIAAALSVARHDPQGVAIVVASDHHIPVSREFSEGVASARSAAEAGYIVTFGVQPTMPSTAYGYIRPGLALSDGSPVRAVDSFIEKPNAARASALIETGCLWNSGNFLFRADVMLAEASRHCPGLVEAVQEALDSACGMGEALVLGPSFRTCPKVSIDIGVMEKTDRAAVIPVSYAWSDLGSWDAIWEASQRDCGGNAVSGLVVTETSEGCLLRAEPGVGLVVVGVKDLAIIAEKGHVLVCGLHHAPSIKASVTALALKSGQGADSGATITTGRDRLVAWLWNDALPTWWCFGADHRLGGFHERLDWTHSPGPHPRRIRVQARQVYVYATAGLMGWPGPWRAAVDHGLAWLESRHRRDDGLYRTLVDQDGSPRDESAHLYDQAFVLLALARAAKALPHQREDLSAKARALLAPVTQVFSLPQGGFRACESGLAVEADPIMHLFEATQAWLDVEPSPLWENLARDIAMQFLDKMMDHDRPQIREEFEADWSPKAGPAGRVIEPGHQFEWAWLLGRWARRTRDARALAAAEGLYETGLAGVDPASGIVLDELTDEGVPTGPMARLWPQAERLRAVLMFETEPEARRKAVSAAAGALESYFTKEPPGLWRDSRADLQISEDSALASSFYHIVGAIWALHGHVET